MYRGSGPASGRLRIVLELSSLLCKMGETTVPAPRVAVQAKLWGLNARVQMLPAGFP